MSTTTKPDLSVTTTDHPNAIRLREAFDAFSRGDLDTVRQSMTDDITWTNAGSSVIAGTHHGWDAVAQMFGTLIETTGGTFTMKLDATFADNKIAVALYDGTSTVKGMTETHRFVLVDDLNAEGKITATHVMSYDQAAADAHMNR